MSEYSLSNEDKIMIRYKKGYNISAVYNSPHFAYSFSLTLKKRCISLEEIIKKDDRHLIYYAVHMKKRFLEIEKNVKQDDLLIRLYINTFFKNHFPTNEIGIDSLLYDIWYKMKIKEIFGYEENPSKIM